MRKRNIIVHLGLLSLFQCFAEADESISSESHVIGTESSVEGRNEERIFINDLQRRKLKKSSPSGYYTNQARGKGKGKGWEYAGSLPGAHNHNIFDNVYKKYVSAPYLSKGKGASAPTGSKGKGYDPKSKGKGYDTSRSKGKGAIVFPPVYGKGIADSKSTKSQSKGKGILMPTISPSQSEPVPTSSPTGPTTEAPTVTPTTNSPTVSPTDLPSASPTISQAPTVTGQTSAPTASPIVQTSPPTTESRFDITLMNMGTVTEYDEIFQEAAQTWESIIVNDLTPFADVPAGVPNDSWFGNRFPDDVVQGPVDDVLIGYDFRFIGPGIVGQAGPVVARFDAFNNPASSASATMIFDPDALQGSDPDLVKLIILHEMGHALGFGTFGPRGRCFNQCPGSFEYPCPEAQNAWNNALGQSGTLFLSNDGGPGSECSHWDEDLFTDLSWSDIMTPIFVPNKQQILSAITVEAIGELGEYVVNPFAAETPPANYVFPQSFYTFEPFDGRGKFQEMTYVNRYIPPKKSQPKSPKSQHSLTRSETKKSKSRNLLAPTFPAPRNSRTREST